MVCMLHDIVAATLGNKSLWDVLTNIKPVASKNTTGWVAQFSGLHGTFRLGMVPLTCGIAWVAC
jgi:hypothetical protein